MRERESTEKLSSFIGIKQFMKKKLFIHRLCKFCLKMMKIHNDHVCLVHVLCKLDKQEGKGLRQQQMKG